LSQFDLVILGGGSGGYAAALRGSQLGLSVALIEADKVGGTCLHRGCIPTKALLHSAEIADGARDGAHFGVKSTFNGIDMARVNSYKDGVINKLYKGLSGFGGVIGCEFASVWKSFGSEVTIIEGLPHLISLEDESSSKQLERAFRKRGINFELGVRFQSAVKTKKGVTVTLEDGKTFDAEILMVSVGRGPVSSNIGYEEQGIAMDRGYVLVDDKCRTNVPGIWAVGDLIPTPQLAHVGFAEGILVAEEIAGLNPRAINYDGIPRVTYSDPEVASVGLTTAEAKKRGHDVVELSYDLAGNGKAQILNTAGSIKLIAQKDGPILGIHMVGARVGELLAEAELIYNWEARASDVAPLIHAHPTLSEAMGEAHMALAGKPLHAHG